MKFADRKTIKFLLVGVVNTIVGSSVMFLLYNIAGCSYWFSSAANYVTGGIVSFFLNKYFTFQNKEHSVQQVLKFILTVAVCYLVAYGISKPLVLKILSSSNLRKQENIAMFFGMGIYTVLNYLGQRFFAFDSKKR